MHLPLFKAMKSINIDDARSTEVVEQLEVFMASKMQESTADIRAELHAVNAKLDATRLQINFFGTMLGLIGLAIAAGPALAALLK